MSAPERLAGQVAIERARSLRARLHSYASPTEDARDDLTIEEAEQIASEDPSLVYLDVEAP